MFSPAPWWLRPQTARDFALGAAAAAALLAVLLPAPLLLWVMAEDGPVEMATVTCYLAAAALVVLLRPEPMSTRCSIMLSLLLLAFGARELDLHKAFTGDSVLRVSFYTGNAPLLQKVVAAGVLVPIAGILFALSRRMGQLMLRARRAEPAAVTVVTVVVTLVLTKVADRSVNVLVEFGVKVTPPLAATILAVEEVLELCLPLLACLACFQACPAAVTVPDAANLAAEGVEQRPSSRSPG